MNSPACVADKSGGALEIVVHPNGSLFAGNDIKRAVQTGQAPIGERLLSAHENENKLFGIDAIPFLATSFDDSDRLWDLARDKIDAALADQNLTMIYSVPWPPQGLYTKKDINSAADLKGLKFRAYNAATARIAELAGMVPVQIEMAELSQALATGVADSFISSGSTGVDAKVWEQLDHFYDVQAWLPRNVVFVNSDSFDALDDAAQGRADRLRDRGADAAAPTSRAKADGRVPEDAGRQRHEGRAARRPAAQRSGRLRQDDDRRMDRRRRTRRAGDHRRLSCKVMP